MYVSYNYYFANLKLRPGGYSAKYCILGLFYYFQCTSRQHFNFALLNIFILHQSVNISCISHSKLFQERQTSGASWLGARLLLFFLRLRLKDIMKSYYPTVSMVSFLCKLSNVASGSLCRLILLCLALQKPERVDDWLVNEMLRAVSALINGKFIYFYQYV